MMLLKIGDNVGHILLRAPGGLFLWHTLLQRAFNICNSAPWFQLTVLTYLVMPSRMRRKKQNIYMPRTQRLLTPHNASKSSP